MARYRATISLKMRLIRLRRPGPVRLSPGVTLNVHAINPMAHFHVHFNGSKIQIGRITTVFDRSSRIAYINSNNIAKTRLFRSSVAMQPQDIGMMHGFPTQFPFIAKPHKLNVNRGNQATTGMLFRCDISFFMIPTNSTLSEYAPVPAGGTERIVTAVESTVVLSTCLFSFFYYAM